MKEITEKLKGETNSICASCGSIFVDTETIDISCPNCHATVDGLYYITDNYWFHIYTRNSKEKPKGD